MVVNELEWSNLHKRYLRRLSHMWKLTLSNSSRGLKKLRSLSPMLANSNFQPNLHMKMLLIKNQCCDQRKKYFCKLMRHWKKSITGVEKVRASLSNLQNWLRKSHVLLKRSHETRSNHLMLARRSDLRVVDERAKSSVSSCTNRIKIC